MVEKILLDWVQPEWLLEFLRGGELRVAIGRTPPRAPPIGHRVPRAVPCALPGHRRCARCSPDDTDSNGRLRCFASWLGSLPDLPSLRTLPRFRSSLGSLPDLPSLRTLPRFRSSLGNLPDLPSLRTPQSLRDRADTTLAVCDACPTEGGS